MAWASRYETWPVRGKLQGKKGKKSKDLSGVDVPRLRAFRVPALSSTTTCRRRNSSP
jgi:hypothetical protein